MIETLIVPIAASLQLCELSSLRLENQTEIAPAVGLKRGSVDPLHVAACRGFVGKVYANAERLESHEASHQDIGDGLFPEVARESAVAFEQSSGPRGKV